MIKPSDTKIESFAILLNNFALQKAYISKLETAVKCFSGNEINADK